VSDTHKTESLFTKKQHDILSNKQYVDKTLANAGVLSLCFVTKISASVV